MIKCCNFINCSTPKEGGAIYISNSRSTIQNNIYQYCYISIQSNAIHGNSVRTISTDLLFSFCSTLMPGPSTRKTSDGCVCTRQGKIIRNKNNATANFGSQEGSLISIWNSYPGTSLKFSQIFDGFGDLFFFFFFFLKKFSVHLK